jgi:uncharacterized protein (DUF1684 family)
MRFHSSMEYGTVFIMKFPRRTRRAAVRIIALIWLSGAALGAEVSNPPAPDNEPVAQHRLKRDAFMRESPQSPFQAAPGVQFSPLKYFPPDRSWVFRSTLRLYETPEAVTIFDTKGRKREGVIFGYLTFSCEGRSHLLRIYRMPGPGGSAHYAIWFTDQTTGSTTYEVGRYLDFDKSDDPGHNYTINFNLAYNPYCAYSPAYGCAVPRKEDRLDLAITAGEKKWHD